MAKSKFTPKPPIEKLSLAVRKDIRDKFESRKEEFQTTIAEKVGGPFVINFNVNEAWAYVNPSTASTEAGDIFARYVEGFIAGLNNYLDKFGDDGKKHFNEAVSQSEVTLAVNPQGDEAPAITAEIKDGVFVILFSHTYFGYYQSSLSDHLLKAIENAPRQGYSLVVKHSIENDYEENIEELRGEIADLLGLKMNDLILDPNFEENYATLEAYKKDKTWQESFGQASFKYFSDGLKATLESKGFKNDELLQEGFAEVVTTKTIKIRIVTKLETTKNKKSTNEPILENGVLYLETTAEYWGYYCSSAAEGLLEIL
ncbi:hypothetical protein BDN72DRAFT_834754 [Pluteus cervinus]|uniref:Uncharacterized protein n=1 Tax=Pluteus cervinus TaxID=181527 RepID=A0ACD3B699_9AGAR|nr:hypothetical protein BDN72DRAFT_834754 [Pluteus cervinus]